MRSLMNSLKLACVYAGVILGAGFASGQEIIQFFTNYGLIGIAGLLLAGLIFALVGWAVLDAIYSLKYRSYKDIAEGFFGKYLGNVMGWIVGIFTFILYCAMISAGGAAIHQVFGWPFSVGALLLAICSFIALLFDTRAIVSLNVALSPLLAFGGLLIGLYTVFNFSMPAQNTVGAQLPTITGNWVSSSLIYVSYNIITAISVLAAIGGTINNKREARRGGIIGGCFIGLLGLCMAIPTYILYDSIAQQEIPILAATSIMHESIHRFYIVLLITAIFTTAVANAFATTNWIQSKRKMNTVLVKLGVAIAAFLLAHIGFSNFVGTLYPLFGYVGLFEMIVFLLYLLVPKLFFKKRYAK